MEWQFTLQAVPLFVASVVATAVVIAVTRKRDVPGRVALAVIAVGAGWWSVTAGLELLVADLFWSVTLNKATYLGIAIVPVAWVVFVLEYTGRRRWLSRPRLGLLAVIPVITVSAVVTNVPGGFHSLFWQDITLLTDTTPHVLQTQYGPLFWVHSGYSYMLLAIGSYMLLELVIAASSLYRRQAGMLLIALMIPWGANLFYLAGVIRLPFDLTILGVVLTSVLLLVLLSRHRLLEIVPAARQLARTELLETLEDPVVVIDDERRVIDLNPEALAVLDVEQPTAIGSDLEVVSPKLSDWLDSDHTGEIITYDVDGVDRFYDIQATPLSQRSGKESGTLLALRDVTARQHNRQQVSVLNRLLRHNLSNAITTILGNAEYAVDHARDDEVSERLVVIEDNAESIKDKQEKLDHVLRTFERERYERGTLADLLDEITESIRRQYPNADLTVETPDAPLTLEGYERLGIALEELLTNAIKHNDGDPPRVTVDATVRDGATRIVVTDDGPGIPAYELAPLTNGEETPMSHGSGVGLWLVSWIVSSLDGTLDFETGDTGTTVTMTIPGVE